MDWLSDPNSWIGLFTLIVLEIVLNIDNLIFIAILAEKLPTEQRNRAQIIGLSYALITRFCLLGLLLWVVNKKYTLFTLFGIEISLRQFIMITGGLFLIIKATMELHERLEGGDSDENRTPSKAVFWQVIAQIVILDLVFSLDSVVTAIGIVQNIELMMIAMTISVAVMMWASRILIDFISKHQTLVILCLGFLIMIGFTLLLDGFGFIIPKSYLYFAISFSILVELLNQVSHRNKGKYLSTQTLRTRTASAVLRMLGGEPRHIKHGESVNLMVQGSVLNEVFQPEEKTMIQGVLELAERPIRSIMSPRNEVEWLDLEAEPEELKEKILSFKHSRIVMARDRVEEFLGVALTKDLLLLLSQKKQIDWESVIKQPLVIHEYTNVLQLMKQLRYAPVQFAIVVDEHGSFEGVVTPTDLLEAIAGDFPDDEESVLYTQEKDGSYLADGYVDIRWISGILNQNLVDEDDHYSTLAGYVLWHLGHLPSGGEQFTENGLTFKVMSVDGRNIKKVKIIPLKKK